LSNLPKPGEPFDSLSDLSKSSTYYKVYSALVDYKEELDRAYDSLAATGQKQTAETEHLVELHRKELAQLQSKIESMKKKAQYQALYMAANKVSKF